MSFLFPGRPLKTPVLRAGTIAVPHFFRTLGRGGKNLKVIYESTTDEQLDSNGIGGSIDSKVVEGLAGVKYAEFRFTATKQGHSSSSTYYAQYIRDDEKEVCYHEGYSEGSAFVRNWEVNKSDGEYTLGAVAHSGTGRGLPQLWFFFTPQTGGLHFEWRTAANFETLATLPTSRSDGIINSILIIGE